MFGRDEFAHQFQHQESGVAFVHVPDFRGETQCPQNAHAANAQHQLLPNPHFIVTRVKPSGEFAVPRVVFGHIGVHQKEVDTADAHLPHLGVHLRIPNFDRNFDWLAVFTAHQFDRGLAHVELLVNRFLPAVRGDALAEIPLGIHKTDTNEVEAEVAGFFDMVAREDAKAARVDGQGVVQAKFGRKIGHQFVGDIGVGCFPPCIFGRQLLIKPLEDFIVVEDKGGVGRTFL